MVVDAALRFARSNPQVLAVAYAAASRTGCSVDDLLLDAVSRLRAESPRAGSQRAAGGQALPTPSATDDGAPRLQVLVTQRRRYRTSRVASPRRTDSNAYS